MLVESHISSLVSPEALDALDCLVWLNSGYRAAEFCGCNQSSISRRAQDAARAFGLDLIRDRADWQLRGPTTLLELEREVHQLHRLRRCSGLRLDVALAWAGVLSGWAAKAWIPACLDGPTPPGRSLALVESRVIDGWLALHSDAPRQDRESLVWIDLAPGLADGAGEGPVLVVRRDLAGHPACDQLLQQLTPQLLRRPMA